MSAEKLAAVELAFCTGRFSYHRPQDARNATARAGAGAGWWGCPFHDRYHVGPAPSIEQLADLAWAARTLAGNEPGNHD